MRPERRTVLESEGWSCAASLEEAVESGATACVIATETAGHVEHVTRALDLGLHALAEKPLACDAAEAAALPALATDRGLHLAVACPLRFEPGLRTVRERLSEIGEIHSVRIECRSYLPKWRPGRDHRDGYWARSGEGGVLRDLIHEVDYALWLFGKPTHVSGGLRPGCRLGIESEEAAEGSWALRDGGMLSMGLDYLTLRAQRWLRVRGERGEIAYDFLTRTLEIWPGEAVEPERCHYGIELNDTYLAQARAFISLVQHDVPTNLCTGEDGVTGLALCDAWRRSDQTGRRERVVE